MHYLTLPIAAFAFSLSSCSKAEEPKLGSKPDSIPEAQQSKPKDVTGELQVLNAQISLYALLAKSMDQSADALQRLSPGPGVAAARDAAKQLTTIKSDLETIQASLKSYPEANLRPDYIKLISKVKQTEADFRETFLIRFQQDENNFSSWFKGLEKSQANLASIIDANYPAIQGDKRTEAEPKKPSLETGFSTSSSEIAFAWVEAQAQQRGNEFRSANSSRINNAFSDLNKVLQEAALHRTISWPCKVKSVSSSACEAFVPGGPLITDRHRQFGKMSLNEVVVKGSGTQIGSSRKLSELYDGEILLKMMYDDHGIEKLGANDVVYLIGTIDAIEFQNPYSTDFRMLVISLSDCHLSSTASSLTDLSKPDESKP